MSETSTLSLKPWTTSRGSQLTLKDVLARLGVERGHFRNVTEASLQEELATEGALELSSDTSSEDEEEGVGAVENTEEKPKTRADLYAAKSEMLQQVNAAEQDILMALDLVSLLQSKEQPAMGAATMSPALKNSISTGVLGLDIWHRMPQDKDLEAQNEAFARTVRLDALQKSADNLLGAARRLEDNVRKETQYWHQILSVSDRGWKISRVPGQQRRLGVRYGFSESAPEFARRGIAALNTNAEGDISLERGIGSKPKALRVTLRKEGTVVGSSRLPSLLDDGESTLETRIRYARDSLFDEELFHEMIRESRIMPSLGAHMKGPTITLQCNQTDSEDDLEAAFELVSLDDPTATISAEREQDLFAHTMALASRMLLSQAHRDRLRRRTEIPAPLNDKKQEQLTLPLLRPVLSFMLHQCAITKLNDYLMRLEKLLSSAQLSASRTAASFELPAVSDINSAEDLTATLLRPWNAETTLRIEYPDANSEPQDLNIHLATSLGMGSFGSTFSLNATSLRACSFESFEELRSAMNHAVSIALCEVIATVLGSAWKRNEREAMIVREDAEGTRTLHVAVDDDLGNLMLKAGSEAKTWRPLYGPESQGIIEAAKASAR